MSIIDYYTKLIYTKNKFLKHSYRSSYNFVIALNYKTYKTIWIFKFNSKFM